MNNGRTGTATRLSTRVTLQTAALTATAFFTSFTAFSQTQAPMPVYQMVDIGTLGGDEAQAVDINDLGEVTGTASTAAGWRHAFIYKDGEMIDLGTLRADRYGDGDSAGASINNKGEVAGEAATQDGLRHAVRYSSGAAIDLGTLGGSMSSGYAINESGQVTGIAFLPGISEYHAFVYSDASGLQDLGSLGDSYSTGESINDAGEVAGIYQNQFETHAYLYSRGSMIDLLPGVSSFVPAHPVVLNSAGHVTGTYRTNGVTRSFLYRDGSIVDLGTLGGSQTFARAVSDSDQVTGDSATTEPGGAHAFLWANGAMEDLGTLGGDFSNGTAINASGEVVGQAMTPDRAYHPFVYSNGAMIDLGLPAGGFQGSATAINAAGQVAGVYQVPNGERFRPFLTRGFVATPVRLLFTRLADQARSAGLGLVKETVQWAAWHYGRSDARRTCATLTAVEIQTSVLSYLERLQERTAPLLKGARALKSTLGCQSAGDSVQAARTSEQTPLRRTSLEPNSLASHASISSHDTEAALQWYTERFGIAANGALIDGRLRIGEKLATTTDTGSAGAEE